jgi:GT2 family glycosyltransferase
MYNKKETISIGWCDNGNTDGKFTEGIAYTVINGQKKDNIKIDSAIRVQGIQLSKIRQMIFDLWADTEKTDWLLWVDSDIYIDQETLKKLFSVANKKTHPVVTGVYFISMENEKSLMKPIASIYNETEDNFQIQPIFQIPANETIKIDSAGMGLVLMHKSVIPRLRKLCPDYSLFAVKENLGDKFISEDIAFFRNLKKAGIPLYANTAALVPHMKRFSFDVNYFNTYWNGISSGQIIPISKK